MKGFIRHIVGEITLHAFCGRIQDIEVLFAEGVVDLGDDAQKLVLLRQAIVKAHGIENIVEVAGRRDEQHVLYQVDIHFRLYNPQKLVPYGTLFLIEIVPVVNRGRSKVVVAEKREGPVKVTQFAQVETVEIEGVAEMVLCRPEAPVLGISLIDA
jgi:hypothetical protein